MHILVMSLLMCVCRTDGEYNELHKDGVFCTEICRGYFHVNFNVIFKTITCAFVGEEIKL